MGSIYLIIVVLCLIFATHFAEVVV
jgi:hypothetical protein